MRFSEVVDILRREMGEDIAVRVSKVLCSEAAGEQVYIPSRHEKPEILPTDTVKTVQKRYGLSQRTAYNWVNRWRE